MRISRIAVIFALVYAGVVVLFESFIGPEGAQLEPAVRVR